MCNAHTRDLIHAKLSAESEHGMTRCNHLQTLSAPFTANQKKYFPKYAGVYAAPLLTPSSKLVDPASDHILRSKTKPCMSKTKQVVSESAYGSINEPSPPREQSTAG